GSGTSFAGSITGSLSLSVVNGTVLLNGTNKYTGSTTIAAGGALILGTGATTGSIAATSPVIDNGLLAVSRSNAVTLGNPISGTGLVTQIGTGTTTLKTVNTYSGGTLIERGTLAVGNASALGTGAITGGFQSDAELLGTVTETLTNTFRTFSSGANLQFTVAAAHGTTLTLNGSAGWSLDSAMSLDFGATGHDGTVVWVTPGGSAGPA